MGIDYKADRSGIKELLKSPEIAALINATARRVASSVQADDLPVEVDQYTTDRRAASVTIAHPAGLAMQAKHGALTKAAAAAGLEVTKK